MKQIDDDINKKKYEFFCSTLFSSPCYPPLSSQTSSFGMTHALFTTPKPYIEPKSAFAFSSSQPAKGKEPDKCKPYSSKVLAIFPKSFWLPKPDPKFTYTNSSSTMHIDISSGGMFATESIY